MANYLIDERRDIWFEFETGAVKNGRNETIGFLERNSLKLMRHFCASGNRTYTYEGICEEAYGESFYTGSNEKYKKAAKRLCKQLESFGADDAGTRIKPRVDGVLVTLPQPRRAAASAPGPKEALGAGLDDLQVYDDGYPYGQAALDEDQDPPRAPGPSGQDAARGRTDCTGRNLEKGPIATIAALVAVAVLAAIVLIANPKAQLQAGGGLDVYASELSGYSTAGYIQTPADAASSEGEPVDMTEACALVSFVRNLGGEPVMIESTTCVIEAVKPIEEPVMRVEPVVAGNELLVYAANDGWAASEDGQVELYAEPKGAEGPVPLSESFPETARSKAGPFEPGDIRLACRYTLDAEKLKDIASTEGFVAAWQLPLYAHGIGSDDEQIGFLTCDENGSMSVKYGGKGGGTPYSTSLFAVYDVEEGPARISFTSPEATPRVEDVFRMETVIAPTRSCTLSLKDVFTVGNATIETPLHEATVNVTVFSHGAFASGIDGGSPLATALAEDPDATQAEIERVASGFVHRPEDIERPA